MIPSMAGKSRSKAGQARRGPRAPLDVYLTVSFRFGDEAGDTVTVMRNRRVPMVESVFTSRDRIVGGFVRLLVRTGLAQPKVVREILPLLRVLKRRRR
jgi:hypothetical protein